jgi:hypothetical protein
VDSPRAVPDGRPGSRPFPSSAPTRTSAYFQEVRAGFDDAVRRCGLVERRYEIGGRGVSVRFAAGAELIGALTRALSHLPAPRGPEPALTILVTDGRGFEPPTPPWTPPERRPTAGADEDARPALYACDDRVHGLLELERVTLSMYDTADAVGVFWVRSAATLPYYERGAPLRAILHWWALDQGWQMAHAGAVGTAAGGVLLVGKGGSGKSTATLACATSGLAYVGDNDVLVGDGPEPFVHGLYCSAKLEPGHRRRALPALDGALGATEVWAGGKELFFLDGALRGSVGVGFPLKAVVLPRVTSAARATVRRVSSAVALLSVAPSTLFALPGARRHRLQHMARALAGVPAYVLELGSDLGTVAPAIRSVLDAA